VLAPSFGRPLTAASFLAFGCPRSDRRGGPAITTTATAGKTEELLQRLAEGVEMLTSSEEWVRYLDVQSRFHRYSFGNVLLISLQFPDATRVAGFRRWLELGRHVQRGQKGIAILAPVVQRLKVEDEVPGEERTIVSAPRAFRVVYVFDVSQTDGAAFPEAPARRLEDDSVAGAYEDLAAYAGRLGFSVEFSNDLPGQVNGDCTSTLHRIRVRAGLSLAQSTKTLAHEIAHAILDDREIDSRERAQVEAESVAYIVCGLLGLDSADYSFGYVAGWGGGDDAVKRVRESGHRIQQTAQQVIAELGLAIEDGP
jgi:hypothetical protein